MKQMKNDPIKVLHVAFGVFATLMLFFTVLVLKDSETSFMGIDVVFGKEFVNIGPWASGKLTFNIIALIAFILPITASLSLMFTKKGNLTSMIIYFAAAILFVMIPNMTDITVSVLGNDTQIEVEWVYGIGLIIALVLSVLGGLLSTYHLYKNHQ